MLWLTASVAAVAPSPATAQASATVRVVRPGVANREEWRRPSTAQRREIVIDDGQGHRVRVRLFEYQ